MRGKLLIGNWKMNKTYREAKDLVQAVDFSEKLNPEVKLIAAMPSLYLSEFQKQNYSTLSFAAQNCHWEKSGAFTGEISAEMLASVQVEYCIVGHSERRSLFGETDQEVHQKVRSLLTEGLKPIVCIGEDLEDRKGGKHLEKVIYQLEKALAGINNTEIEKVILAYEPVWAIGTGETASGEQVQEIHAAIRSWLEHNYNATLAQKVNILYGGSCKPSNATGLFAQEDVDGGLIGGASLNAQDFINLTNCF